MGFLSFNLQYYENEISRLEGSFADGKTIYTAKQLLKILDDLNDENYPRLSMTIEENCHGVTRLKNYLDANHAQPFFNTEKAISAENIRYDSELKSLTSTLQSLARKAAAVPTASKNAFLNEIVGFCEWVGYADNCAYIFLLRDTLLPYIYYQNKQRTKIHPWLLGRRTLAYLTDKPDVDDQLRAAVYKALESEKAANYHDFCSVVLPEMRAVITQYPKAERTLLDLLHSIDAKRIAVIESGCCGTFPMLLKSLDERVDIRMYTTYPYLQKAYGNRVFSAKYEHNRLFETLYSQDVYLQFAALRDGEFFVRTCQNEQAEACAFAEVKYMLTNSSAFSLPTG